MAVLVVFGVAAWSIRQGRASVAASLLLLVLSAECLSDFVVFVRPQLATFALFALTLAILRNHWERPSSRSIWLLPILMAVWVNLHGGFLAGIGILGLFVAGWIVRSWRNRDERPATVAIAIVCGLSLAATLINPYGVELHAMLWEHLVTAQPVREWQPLWQSSQSPVYYVPFLVAAIALAASRRWKWIDLVVIVVVACQAICHLRHVALFSIATLVLLPGPLSDSLDRLFPSIRRQLSGQRACWRRVAGVAAVVLFLLALQVRGSRELWRAGIAPWEIGMETRSQVPGMPMTAVSLLKRENISGNLVTDYGWGQFVIWHLHPQVLVAFDGRYRTVYPAAVEREFMQFQQGRQAEELSRLPIIDSYPTEIALLPVDSRMAKHLAKRADWFQLFRDDQSVLLVADIPKFRTVIRRAKRPDWQLVRFSKWETFPGDAGSSAVGPSLSLRRGTANSQRNGTGYATSLPAH